MNGKVYLVGAGCGEYELITLKGMRLMQGCDAVVYDSLIDTRLLDFVPPSAERICVGKRAGKHSEPQERINEILIEKALQGKAVVRLKGGDPFVFGRGGEEILELQKHNIPYSIVPGISSCIAVPELAGIPVTHRRSSRSFHVITAHTADDLPDYSKYAKLDGTLVFLMGLSRLSEISQGLITGGMSPKTPAAVISKGASPGQRIVKGTLENIKALSDEAALQAPAIIAVGENCKFDFRPNKGLPLNGITVAVTGTKRFSHKLSVLLENNGADVQRLNNLIIREYEDNPRLDDALKNIVEYNWLVLTSINGAEIFLARLKKLGIDLRKLASLKLAVIGRGTAENLAQKGIFADLVPEKFTAEELARALSEKVGKAERVLILRAQKGSPVLTDILSENNVSFKEIKTYDVTGNAVPEKITADYITFASASGVDIFFSAGGEISPHTKILCIGDITAQALSVYNKSCDLISGESSAAGIVNKILEDLKNE